MASDAEDLFAQLADAVKEPEVLITDLRLGGTLDGIELALRMRTRAHSSALHVVLISGDTAPEALARARAVGLPLLHKPLRPAKLRALLHRMLGAERASGLER